MEPHNRRSPESGESRLQLVWAAIIWLLLLMLYVPAPNTSRSPLGAFFWFKVVTSAISIAAIAALIYVPRGWRKILTIPLALLLAFVQVIAWIHLP